MNMLLFVTAAATLCCPPKFLLRNRPSPPPMYYYYVPPQVVPTVEMPKEKSLYERLGGEPAIKAVIDDFVARTAANPKVNFTRKGTAMEWEASPANVALLKSRLVELVGMVTGGPQKYTGRSMKASHKGMGITDAEFGAMAGDLKATLDKFNVPAKEQEELLKIVGSTRADIVEK